MEGNCWNTEVLDTLFLSIDNDNIKHIPIINMEEEDQSSWMFTNNGHCTVISGYNYIMGWNKYQRWAPLISLNLRKKPSGKSSAQQKPHLDN